MKSIRKKAGEILQFLPFVLVFLFSLYTPSDPDLGWHLKYGEYFFTHFKILRNNTFSTLMPNYHWANVSWGTDIITYAAYHLGGFLGLTILGAVVVVLTFYFFAKSARLTVWQMVFLFPLLLYLEKPVNSVSFRGQQISLLLLGVLFYLINRYQDKPKILYYAIPLFLVWVNLNGEFLLGLGMLGLWVVLYLGQKLIEELFINNKELDSRLRGNDKWSGKANLNDRIKHFVDLNKKDVGFIGMILGLSGLATFINPFGVEVHRIALSHFGSPLLKYIAEYLPFQFMSELWWNQVGLGVLVLLGLIFLYFTGRLSKNLPLLGMMLFLLVLSFQVRRFAWPAYYFVLPILAPLPVFLKPDRKKAVSVTAAVILTGLSLFAIYMQFPFTHYTKMNWNTYCQDINLLCSPASADYLQEHGLKHGLYTLYGWGGWLIWNYPAIKPVIDGRMHLWVDEKTGYSAFTEYYWLEQDMNDIDKSHYDVVYMAPNKPLYKRLVRLTEEGKWKLVYQDKMAGIFVRKE